MGRKIRDNKNSDSNSKSITQKSRSIFKWIIMIIILILFLLLIAIFLWGNRSKVGKAPQLNGLMPVQNFDIQKYVGTWFEQARVDYSFEKGLSQVTANYGILQNGLIQVLNTGHEKNNKIAISQGSARTTDIPGVLLVSFFPFIEAPYIVLYVDDQYTTAVVGSSTNMKYLWLLTRNNIVQQTQLDTLKSVAKQNGYSDTIIQQMVFANNK